MTLTEARAEALRQSWTTWSPRHVIRMPSVPDQYMVATNNEWLDDPALADAELIATYEGSSIFDPFRF